MILYKRNAKGQPISWSIQGIGNDTIKVEYGVVGKTMRIETYNTHRKVEDEIASCIKSKQKEGYKSLQDLYDNSHMFAPQDDIQLIHYLNNYLPKFNTHENGEFIPMLCKTLEDNKPFERGYYSGQWKINGERCIITLTKSKDLFFSIKPHYRSREGVDWTDKLSYLDSYILNSLDSVIIEMMLEEGVGLDGELYIPGYGINEINSFIKNEKLPQHYQLQFWCYDLCIDNMSAIARYSQLESSFNKYLAHITTLEDHLNNKNKFVLLPSVDVNNITQAIEYRDKFINLGFEGLVIREINASYQFGGRRNNSMLKFKKIEDGKFTIVNIVPEGKRVNLPKFICMNDINDELFECTINQPQSIQEQYLINKDKYIGKLMLVEYRERSGIKQVPFHAKGIKIMDTNNATQS